MDLYEVSLEFWEQMEQAGYANQTNLFQATARLGLPYTEERQAERLRFAEQGHLWWLGIFAELRAKSDPEQDTLWYFHSPGGDKRESSERILIVRGSKIRDRVSLDDVKSGNKRNKP
ncbi:MAG: hypothetical protein C5B50_20630 [Verrucomicrobia bacterium]|nr:MAG: hypothetical protein C5B50_20630 [Verrucomicrobiota bacterium]